MRFVLITLGLMTLPAMALAQTHDNSPILLSTETKAAAPAPVAEKAPAPAPAAAAAPAGNTPAPSQMNAAEKILNTFPDWAISKAGADTTGQTTSLPPSAPAAPQPEIPATPANPASPSVPEAPKAPAPVLDKLWPKDTVPIFLRSCTGFHPELVNACSCVITRLIVTMPHDEFMKLSEANTLNDDARVITIRQQCLGTPGKRGQ